MRKAKINTVVPISGCTIVNPANMIAKLTLATYKLPKAH